MGGKPLIPDGLAHQNCAQTKLVRNRHNVHTKQPPTRDNLPIAQFKPPLSQSNTLSEEVFKELLINYSVFIK